MIQRTVLAVLALSLVAVAAAGCGGKRTPSPDSGGRGFHVPLISGGGSNNPAPPGLAVNSFLWSATLDTIAFMPLDKADSNSGLIETEWYSNPEAQNERFKVSVRILDTRLRADGIKVSLYRQVYAGDRGWIDAETDPASAVQIENAILTRAQQLRVATLEN